LVPDRGDELQCYSKHAGTGAENVAGFGKKNSAYKFSVIKHELEGL